MFIPQMNFNHNNHKTLSTLNAKLPQKSPVSIIDSDNESEDDKKEDKDSIKNGTLSFEFGNNLFKFWIKLFWSLT